jgi:CHAD domain-containing protein
MRATLRLPDDWDFDSIIGSFGIDLVADRPRTVRVSFLDTFDWRLAAAGVRLNDEIIDGDRSLRWMDDSGEPPHVIPVASAIRFAGQLPESVLRSRLEKLAGVRALLPVGEAVVERRAGRIRDQDGNTTVLLHLERAAIVDGSGRSIKERISTAEATAIPGSEEAFHDIVGRLRAVSGGDARFDLIELAAGTRGRRIGDYSSKLDLRLDRSWRAVDAVREILLHLAGTLRANVDGVVADHDTEFLHDLRVATRRTRAALAQLKGVLPAEAVAGYREEFRWLGALTGPCRDLDVYLLEMDTFRAMLGDGGNLLAPLQRTIERARRDAWIDVCSGLTSARFRRLLERWETFLREPPVQAPAPPDADRPIGELASQKILKAYRRMTKRGRGLGDDPPADALHRLRIEAKKLRYLLEFFRSLYDDKDIGRLVKSLKELQDILGGINDLHVQREQLVEFAHQLAAEQEVETVLAMGRLTAALEQRQNELRQQCSLALGTFASPANRARYAALFDHTDAS